MSNIYEYGLENPIDKEREIQLSAQGKHYQAVLYMEQHKLYDRLMFFVLFERLAFFETLKVQIQNQNKVANTSKIENSIEEMRETLSQYVSEEEYNKLNPMLRKDKIVIVKEPVEQYHLAELLVRMITNWEELLHGKKLKRFEFVSMLMSEIANSVGLNVLRGHLVDALTLSMATDSQRQAIVDLVQHKQSEEHMFDSISDDVEFIANNIKE